MRQRFDILEIFFFNNTFFTYLMSVSKNIFFVFKMQEQLFIVHPSKWPPFDILDILFFIKIFYELYISSISFDWFYKLRLISYRSSFNIIFTSTLIPNGFKCLVQPFFVLANPPMRIIFLLERSWNILLQQLGGRHLGDVPLPRPARAGPGFFFSYRSDTKSIGLSALYSDDNGDVLAEHDSSTSQSALFLWVSPTWRCSRHCPICIWKLCCSPMPPRYALTLPAPARYRPLRPRSAPRGAWEIAPFRRAAQSLIQPSFRPRFTLVTDEMEKLQARVACAPGST